MSRIVGDTACPQCRSMGRDSTGNHLILFEDGGKHCNRCGYTVLPNMEESEELGDNMQWDKYTVKDVLRLPVGSDPKRKLSKETNEHFRTRVEYNTATGEIDKVFYPYIKEGRAVGYKIRKHFEENDPEVKKNPGLLSKFKCFRAIGDVKDTLYNLHNTGIGGKRLLIVEGEEDAAAAYEMLAKYNPKVVSIPSGATINKEGKGILDKGIIAKKEEIDSFEEVYVCFDNDAAGKAITEALATLIGPKVKVVKISEKDASDMLVKGKQQEFVSAFFGAKNHVPDGFITVEDVYEQAIEMPKWGRKWPWPSLDKLTYGRRDGEGVYVGSAVKGGKTQFKDQMAEYIITQEKLKIFVCAFEQEPGVMIKGVASKLKHKQFHNPEHADKGLFTQSELIEAVDELKDKLIIFRASFSDVANGNMWDRLKPAIRHAVVVEGVKDVFIDPITQLTDGLTPTETETELRRFSNEIQGMAQDLGFFYYCFAHLKEPVTGATHEEGGAIKVAQFRGSRSMAEKTKFMLGIIRNQYADDLTERNTSTFHLLLNSGFGKSGKFDVYYNEDTGTYLEPEQQETRF